MRLRDRQEDKLGRKTDRRCGWPETNAGRQAVKQYRQKKAVLRERDRQTKRKSANQTSRQALRK